MVANQGYHPSRLYHGEYRNKFFITDPNEQKSDPKLFGIESFSNPENQFNPERVTKRPNCILFQTAERRQIYSGNRWNESTSYDYSLSINTWIGGP